MSFKLYRAINQQIDYVIRRPEIYDWVLERQGKTVLVYMIYFKQKK